MQLSNYLKILKKNFVFIVTLTALGAIVAFASTSFIKSGVIFERTLFVKITETSSNINLRVDVQALTDTTVAYLQSTDFLNSTGSDGASVSVRKQAPQVVKLTVTSQSAVTSKEISKAVTSTFNQRVKDLISTAQVELVETGDPNEPAIQVLNSKILAVFGAFLGFTLSLVVMAISQYFKI